MPLLARGTLFAVRTQGSPETELGAIRQAFEKINPETTTFHGAPGNPTTGPLSWFVRLD
jgi:hypothetical protein